MKTGIVVKTSLDLCYGQTVDVVEELGASIRVIPHGDNYEYLVPRENILLCEDVFNYDKRKK
jgi:hypothetical protein